MGRLKIYNLDPQLAGAIRQRAKAAGKSVNQTVKELLAEAVGCGPPRIAMPVDHPFEKAVEDTEQIDPED